MKIYVSAKPKSKKTEVKVLPDLYAGPGEVHCSVWVAEPPEGGRANDAIRKALAGHFKVPESRIKLVSGQTSRKKIFILSETE